MHACCPLNVLIVGYELNDGVWNFVNIILFLFTVSNASFAHVQSYWYSVMLPWIVKPFVIWWQLLCKAVYVECLYLNLY